MPIKNPYTATSAEVGDVFIAVVTCHITPLGYQLYRCMWPPQMSGDTPQGPRMFSLEGAPLDAIVRHLFSVVPNYGVEEAK